MDQNWNWSSSGVTFAAGALATPIITYTANANANPLPFLVPGWPVAPALEDEFTWLKRRVDEVVNH